MKIVMKVIVLGLLLLMGFVVQAQGNASVCQQDIKYVASEKDHTNNSNYYWDYPPFKKKVLSMLKSHGLLTKARQMVNDTSESNTVFIKKLETDPKAYHEFLLKTKEYIAAQAMISGFATKSLSSSNSCSDMKPSACDCPTAGYLCLVSICGHLVKNHFCCCGKWCPAWPC